VAFSPDGKSLTSASGDKTIKLWETASGKERARGIPTRSRRSFSAQTVKSFPRRARTRRPPGTHPYHGQRPSRRSNHRPSGRRTVQSKQWTAARPATTMAVPAQPLSRAKAIRAA
jgi:hypothetical protein